MKDRFNILDTYAIIKELQHFNSYRVNNIYDIDNKTFLIKFDDFENKRKCFIIIKSGQYLYHIYNPPQERRKLPSSFCMKLRKHIKNKRLQSIEMLKSDRVIQLKFGTDEHQYKLIIELFSFGNIILCNKDNIMLTLLRTHVYENDNKILVNHQYPIEQLNNNFNNTNNTTTSIQQDIEYINQSKVGYYHNKEVSPLPLNNSITMDSFNDVLNKFIKINIKKSEKKKKKVKLTPEESIRKHAKEKINKLNTNIIKIHEQINWSNENPVLIKDLLQNSETVDKDHHIVHQNYKLVKTMNYHQNINHLYSKIKELNNKIKKTELGSENAIQKLQKIHKQDIKKEAKIIKNKSDKITLLNDKWYQEYHWFYTTNNLLVICGKNSTQSETIVKKHMDKNDLYFHSEVSGSGSAIIKNPDKKDISPVDLEETGSFVICHSKAWKDKTPDYAYWVNPEQVSKTTESGEFIQKGAFIIRGKKNYIYRTQLELGCTILNNQFMLAPYKCIQKYDKNKIKIMPGNHKRKKSLDIIINKLRLARSEYDKIDEKIPYGIKVNKS
jgi:predicted ribosome quality control (RQC) complex YloA/Tae2 family protein